MTFKNLTNIKYDYQTLSDEVVHDFFIPTLSKSISYKRAVGFFSSNVLLDLTKGLSSFALNGGKMQLLIAPTLTKEDYDAIKNGYDKKEYLNKKIESNFDEFIEYNQKKDRFGLLSFLIKNSILDIKIVFIDSDNDKAIFHEKLGIMYDEDDNMIAFSGSANATYQGYHSNYENIDVYCSWISEESRQRCISREIRFNNLWRGREKGTFTLEFPKIIKEKILAYSSDKESIANIDLEWIKQYKRRQALNIDAEPSLDNIILRDYQKNAINVWKDNHYVGIADACTGAGKTFLGLAGLVKLFEEKKRVFAWICCPYTHLVDQWKEEVKLFNINPIVCYGSFDKYRDKLKRAVMKFYNQRTNFVCVIITNASFKTDNIQKLFDKNINQTLLMVDEAHNFGAYQLSKFMKPDVPYRLALSATLDRYGDPNGTKKLYNYFGKKCIEYTLSQAIEEKKLTPYKYYPIIVCLTDEELEKYIYISKKIAKLYSFQEKDEEPSEEIKRLLIKRSRIVSGAKNKVDALKNELIKYRNENNILVYCGAVKYGNFGYEQSIEEKKQIDIVLKMMTNDLKIKACRFTSEETIEERRNIINAFKTERVQSLVAIKCLDEGMNVPAIKTAFILASSTNPKEYIQRRGRVLRKYPGKECAEIYDFITLPISIKAASSIGYIDSYTQGLVKRELMRMKDFVNLSSNPSFSNNIINEIMDAFNMDIIQEEVSIYE